VAGQVIQQAIEDPRHHHLHYHSEALKAACCQSVSVVVHSSVDEFHSEPCPKHQQVDDSDDTDIDDTYDNTCTNDNVYDKVIARVLARVVHLINEERYCEPSDQVN